MLNNNIDINKKVLLHNYVETMIKVQLFEIINTFLS